MQAITAAANHLGGKYLTKCTLYVTLEPVGCVLGLSLVADWKGSFWRLRFETRLSRNNPKMFHPKTEVTSGIMAVESSALLKQFFQDRRSDY